jgi:hypothetical protein
MAATNSRIGTSTTAASSASEAGTPNTVLEERANNKTGASGYEKGPRAWLRGPDRKQKRPRFWKRRRALDSKRTHE